MSHIHFIIILKTPVITTEDTVSTNVTKGKKKNQGPITEIQAEKREGNWSQYRRISEGDATVAARDPLPLEPYCNKRSHTNCEYLYIEMYSDDVT